MIKYLTLRPSVQETFQLSSRTSWISFKSVTETSFKTTVLKLKRYII